jgi:hypothetical protein
MTSDVDLTNHPDPAALRPAAMWLRYDSRADGWTPGRRAAFLTHLADNGVVAEAAAAVGKSLASAYALRRRASGYAFNLGWEAALLLARRRVADELMTAAIKGETAVWTREEGKTIYTRFNPRTALALLDRVNPATSLNEVMAVAQHFDWFRDLIDEAADLWPLFDTSLDEGDFDARSRVRINLQLSDESADFEGADKQDRLEPDDEDGPPIEYKSMPVGEEHSLGNCAKNALIAQPRDNLLREGRKRIIACAHDQNPVTGFGDGAQHGAAIGADVRAMFARRRHARNDCVGALAAINCATEINRIGHDQHIIGRHICRKHLNQLITHLFERAVTMRLKHHQQPPGEGVERAECGGDLIGVMPEIIDHGHAARNADHFKPPPQPGKAANRLRRFAQIKPCSLSGAERGHGVRHIMLTRNLK